MNEVNHTTRREELLAELTDAAYRIALRHGTRGPFIDLELDIWEALRQVLDRPGKAGRRESKELLPCRA